MVKYSIFSVGAAGLLWEALLLLLTWISFNKHIFNRWLSFSFFLLCSTPIWSFYGLSVKTLLLPLFLFFLGNIEVGSWLSLRYGLTSEGLTYVFVTKGFSKAVSSSAMSISHWLTSNNAGRFEVLSKRPNNWLFGRRNRLLNFTVWHVCEWQLQATSVFCTSWLNFSGSHRGWYAIKSKKFYRHYSGEFSD